MTERESLEDRKGPGLLSKYLGYMVKRREPVGDGVHLTAAQVNARPLVGSVPFMEAPQFNGPQGGQGNGLAPDGVRYSLFDNIGRLFGARIPVYTSAYDQTAWENQFFVGGHLAYVPGGSIPFGNMLPERERANIEVPQTVAYGSQFEYQALPYGYV